MSARSFLAARVFLHGVSGGEGHAALGVDLMAVAGAPGDELLRVQIHPHQGDAAARALGIGLFGLFAPSVIAAGEQVCVRHDLQNAGVITAAIPDDADGGHIGERVTHEGLQAGVVSGPFCPALVAAVESACAGAAQGAAA